MSMDNIYHYTSIETLHNILKTYRDSKEKNYLVFWASSIYALNDPLEMISAKDVIGRIIKGIEEELDVQQADRISTQFKETEVYKTAYERTFARNGYIFVMSFSSNKDTLPMWSMYAKNGKGVCLCFDKKALLKHFEEDKESETRIIDVSYGLNKIEQSTLDLLKATYLHYLKELKQDTITDKESIKYCYLYILLRQLAPMYKDCAYEYEGEQRLLCTKQRDDENIDFRVSSEGYIIPYRKIKIPIETLKRIVIGPTYDYELISSNLKFAMIIYGIKGVEIEKSHVNYRRI